MKKIKDPELTAEELKEVNAIVGMIKTIQKVGKAFEGFRIILIPTYGKPFVAQASRTERGEELLEAVTAQCMTAPYSWGTHLRDGKDQADEAE
jgi:hypothetical protein